MRPAADHLTSEEIFQFLIAGSQPEESAWREEVELHLRRCEQCTRLKEDYRAFMSKLYEFARARKHNAGPCPPPAVWAEVAGGQASHDTAFELLQHASVCVACASELFYALEAIGSDDPVSEQLQNTLVTASPEWRHSFAARLASQGPATVAEQPVRSSPLLRKPVFSIFRGWQAVAIAAVLAIGIGLAVIARLYRPSPDSLIQEAYAQQRTIEMRIPGAGYGAVKVERAGGSSSISSPLVLLKAEVLIKAGLEKTPDDPDLLRQKAEADLLTWNYQQAIESLNRVSRQHPDSFAVLVDLATAYFERAEATASPADYEAGLQYLGDAIRLQPSNPAGLFNRAILLERLYFYDRAIADWEQFLKLEREPRWRQEGERRLKDIRARVHEHSSRYPAGQPSPGDFLKEVETGPATPIEEYLSLAERGILPGVNTANSQDDNYRAALALARRLQSAHRDPFFADMLLTAHAPRFSFAAQMLGESSAANHGGHFELAHARAVEAAAAFKRLGNVAGWLAAQFEAAYALQFEAQAHECQDVAAIAADAAAGRAYIFSQVQLMLEDVICSNMSGNVGAAKSVLQRALSLARDHQYQDLYLRGLTLLAVLESDAGDDASAWSSVQEGLALYWTSKLSPVRAYSLYTVLDRMAERRGHANVQFAALSEALAYRSENSNLVVEASAHARLGDAALRLGELATAEVQFAEARRIFAAEPQTDSVRWRVLEARLNLARVQTMRGAGAGQALQALGDALPEIRRLSNRYLEFLYYETLAELKQRAGDNAFEFLEQAIRIAELGTESLSSWSEKLAWMDQHRGPYVALTKLLSDSGSQERALEAWERYRALGEMSAPASRPGAHPRGADAGNLESGSVRHAVLSGAAASPQTRILTYAFVPEKLLIWVHGSGEIHLAQVPVSERDVQRTAENFIAECGRPDSDLAGVRADSHALYAWLIEPVRRWLPVSGHLVVEPDGVLGRVPLEALMDGGSNYLGSRYAITVALSVKAGESAVEPIILSNSARALIVAAPASPGAALAPPPGALNEAGAVAAHFSGARILQGDQANLRRVEVELGRSSLFHFAGHAAGARNGAAILLADGALGLQNSTWLQPGHLRQLQLAVFSACATARSTEISESRSLVTAFLHAGARNVVASRWNVDSSATADFMGSFYGALASTHNVAQALQFAGDSFRRSHEHAHPYYWAAFTAFGST